MGAPDVEVALLGPPEVRRDGVAVTLPPGRPTVILAALALRGGVTAAVDELVQVLWPDAEPRRPRATIQTHVTRLRAVLGREVVRAAGDGYRLDLPASSIDLVRFRELVGRGPDTSDPAAELRRIEQALALWRGEPLSGLTPDALTREVAPLLVEELLAATERRNALVLQLGHVDEEFVPSVRRLLAVHPWRERLWGQLMLALYRQGRRGDALAAYHELAGVLREELGIDPSAELADLHGRILASDQELLVEQVPATPAAGAVPSQLPRPVADFVGREDETKLLLDGLTPGPSWVRVGVISGPGGSGKTSLALRVAHLLRETHPDGQLFAELHGSGDAVEPGDVLADFLRALGFSAAEVPATVDERSAMFRSACAGRQLVVVLDDARDPAQIGPLLPAADGCAVLVTSRPQLGVVPADVRIDLELLPDHAAHDLLTGIVGAERLAAEPDATGVVVGSCQGSPLALRIAGGRLASRPSWPIGHLADQLSGSGRLDALEIGDLSVRATLAASVQALRPDDAARLRLLAAQPGGEVDVESAAVVWDVTQPEARACLERLVDVRLIDSGAPDQYRWHDLVDDYLRAESAPDEIAPARRRLIRYFLRSVHNTWPLVRQGGEPAESASWFPHDVTGRDFADRDEVHAWLNARWVTVTALGRLGLRAQGRAEVDEAAALLLAMGRSGYECCRDTRIEGTARAVLEGPAPSDRTLVARAWHGLALALGDQRRHREALEAGTQGLAVRRELGDRYGEVIMLHNMAVWHELDRRYDEAAELFEQCAAADDVLSPQLRSRCRRNLAHVQISTGRIDEARRNIERAWAESDEHLDVDHYDHAIVLGQLCREAGRVEEAVEHYDRAVEQAGRIGSASLRAASLTQAARARRLAGRDGAEQVAQALAFAREARSSDAEAEALVEHGHARAARGAVTDAAEDWRRALRLYESLRSVEVDHVRELLSTTEAAERT
ncbi:DNA-binding SARP family transcriptional activator [Haloactinopolyspora alba]|uniref:DNA-binding SARP family transcriptional activator n=1 Tax=Haloactinopolyspora alba TaxID=648780 RepID=A0A2P8E732_9ACTN|nr:BTAD domain-containing putative transcriptional regulator [Haloactinopolyspora alba]PSL05284.1 DNA-binding SARP family transcriptional activator [Haloactinopolyspora alba]